MTSGAEFPRIQKPELLGRLDEIRSDIKTGIKRGHTA